ncbi:hypothetical protein CHLRE_01g049900v5 [Chlamydomonas reinhardtii]|uniref:Uncharacterized protein n=1 Tax=Chlamydomonas reinhardtii TaxID=3055 RepID=A0A2K3E7Y7_CHLRE|nr:uncharacterized protein CHLRE_01g049900v5 [Chlamydomonas reinhardtii]PNW88899.1 hypothetical protein CHLRE_01g049900v5 [Chlamydomonas reinhardtii]
MTQQKEADLKRIRAEEEAMKRKAQEIIVKQQEAARANGLPFKLVIRGTDFAPVVVWSVILAALAAAYRSRFVQWLLSGGSKQPTGGKWVYDRSLGGRKVWVPDSNSFDGPTTATSMSEKAGRSRMDEDFERLSSFAAAARTGGDASTSGSGVATGTLPTWWDAPPVLYASASRKAACEAEAGRIMSRLESAKNRGEDYSLADIRALRKTCQEGHVSVKPKTVGGRDAIFRAAVEAAVAAAQARNFESLDEASPPRFVAGVAADLGMEDGRAVGIAVAVVASAVRARLLDAVTNMKLSRTDPEAMTEAVYALARIASLLEYLPALDTETPQVDMVASSLRAASSLEERRYLFHLLAQLTEDKAALAARLLDFDPKLVIPEQQAALQAARVEQAEFERLEAAAQGKEGQAKNGAAQGQQKPGAAAEPAKDGQAGTSSGEAGKDAGAA